jgi:Tol biopolymer transport system component
MELVEGRTLREILAGGAMPPRRLLPIAAQIADGLAKAHESGIVHRDLKPENVMVNRDGFVKILDFGLAKLSAPSLDGGSQLATLAGPGTRPGVVMGTVGYMSPEQASGEAVDFRSDQFALGSILYEMATGQRAFQKKTAIETLSAILREDPPPIASANPQAPAPLRWIVERCLAKEPADRYAATRDLARDLKQAERHLSETSMEAPAVARPRRRPMRWAAALGLLAVGVVAGLALRMRAGAPASGETATLRRLTFGAGLEDEPAISPDGKFLAYTTDERGNLDVVVLPLAGGEPIRLASTDADEAQPAWSPDGSRIAFVSAKDHGGRLASALNTSSLELYLNSSLGDIYVAPALGGAAAKLVEDGHYPSWSPDGKRIVFMSNRGGQVKLWTVSSDGGAPTQLTREPVKIDYQPAWSPDGKWIAYGSGSPSNRSGAFLFNLAVIPAAGGAARLLTSDFSYVTHPAWAADGKAIFFAGDRNGILNLFRVPFRDGPVSVPPSRVTLGQGQDSGATVSRDGRRLAFAALRNELNVWELTLDGMSARAVTSGAGSPDYPHVSPDGKTILVQSNQTGNLAVWTVDLQGRFLSRLTPDERMEPSARWSPDGTRFGYVFNGKLRIQSLGSLSAVETGVSTNGSMSWSPDGRILALGTSGVAGEIRLYDVASGKIRTITALNQWVDDPTWSPDGRQIAFMLQRGQVREIWVVPSDGGTPRALTKDLEDSHPFWSPKDPDSVLFLRNHKRLATLSVSTGKVTLLPWNPEGSYVLDYPTFSPDGKKVYFSVARKTGDIYQLEGF